MGSRLAAAVIVSGLIAAVVWLLLAEGTAPPTAAARDAAASLPSSSVMSAAMSAASDDADRAPPRTAVDDSAREPVAPEPATAPKPAPGTIVGRVVDPDDRGVPSAIVAAIPLLQGEPSRSDDKSVVKCDDQGRFELVPPKLAVGQEVALVARAEGFRPTTLRWLWSGEPGDQERVLRLEQGYALAGRVVRDGEGVKAKLSIDLRYGTPGVHGLTPGSPRGTDDSIGFIIKFSNDGLSDEAFWTAGRMEEKVATVESDDEGTFHFTGLGPYEYRLAIHVKSELPHLGERFRQVHAPDEGLLLDVSDGEIEVRASSLGTQTEGMVVHVRRQHGRLDLKADHGTATFAVEPNTQATIRVEHPRCRPIEQTITAPGPDQRMVVDVPMVLVERPSLLVQLDGAAAQGIDSVKLHLTPTGGGETVELPVESNMGSDRFEVPAVPLEPGEYRLVVTPADKGERSHYLLPVDTVLQLPASGTVTAELTAELAGRIDLHVDDPGHRSYHATVRDAAGNVVLTMNRSFMRFGKGNFFALEFGSAKPDDAEEARQSARMVRPGSYRVTVEPDGAAAVAKDIDVLAGETTPCKVTVGDGATK